ncbi:ABC transporter permease [Novosphingobium lentum]|uniref:ABC transporter permease n=1 Tax=Novosphingobium lentum TaxID=145287 RepID=UPI000AE57A0F|nr:FtsX-like permease family protein [Novosphingobium lentum]
MSDPHLSVAASPRLGWGSAWAIARRGLDWRFRGLRLLIACLVLGTAALAAIGTLTGAIQQELMGRGRVLLGGDVEVSVSQREAAPDELAALNGMGRVSAGMRLQAIARVPGNDTLAVPIELKQVDAAWPLYGTLTVTGPDGAAHNASAPQGLSAWIAPGVADRLRVKPGDRLLIGNATLSVGGIVADEPDRLGEGFSLGPTVIVSRAALDASGLVQPGSMAKAKYRLRLPPASDPDVVSARIKHEFPAAGFDVRTRERAVPGLYNFIERMGQFLVLVALAALAIAGIGIGNGVTSYLEARRGSIATLKILGATGGDIARIYLLQLGVTTALAIVAGLAIGLAVTPVLGWALSGLLPIAPGVVFDPRALAIAAAYGALIALTFAAPPLLRARDFPAMTLMRARVSPMARGWRAAVLPVGASLAGIAALAIGTSPQPWLAAGFLGGAAALFVLLAALGFSVSWLAARSPRPKNSIARMALANLHRPGAQTGALVVALGFGLSAFVLLAGVETSLDANIAQRVPARAPDYFVLDVPRPQAEAFGKAVHAAAPRADVRMVPALRGTITAYGPAGRMIRVADMAKIPDDAWPLRGERGLTYAATVPDGNSLTAGQWWPADYAGPPLVSIDEKLAQALNLSIGDELTISLLGIERTARIASLRRIDWDSMGFNYVLVFSPNAIADAPHNLAATIELPASEKTAPVRRALLTGLVRGFPSTSVIEVGPVIAQARHILGQMGTAILSAASVAILAGLAVLAGAIAAAREARAYDNVILRVLGASRRQLLTLLLAEYAVLAGVLAVLALALGSGAAWLVIVELFDFAWLPNWGRILAVLGTGLALVIGLAVGGSLGALRTRPAAVLREL